MKVIFEAYLCEPPSSVHCFRDVTLYLSIIKEKDLLVECKRRQVDLYYNWLKKYGAFDFIEDIIPIKAETGYRVGSLDANLKIDRINEYNLPEIISKLKVI